MNSIHTRTDERRATDRRLGDRRLVPPADKPIVGEWMRWGVMVIVGAMCAYFASQNAINVALEGKASKETVNTLQIDQASIRANQANMKESLDRLSVKIEKLPQEVVNLLRGR